VITEEWNQEINDHHYREAYRLLDKNSRQRIDESTWLKYWEENKQDTLQKESVLENNQWRIRIN